MSRVASVVLLVGGLVLCVTWLVSPASSSPQASSPSTARNADPTADALTVEPVHLDAITPPPYVAPKRDPFSFQVRDTAPRAAKSPTPQAVVPVRPPVRLPTLVAIVRDNAAGGDAYRAAITLDGFDVTIVSAGQIVGGFVVDRVRSDAITVTERSSGDSFDVALR